MASGRPPLEGASSAELASAILRDTPRPLSELRADLPEELCQLIQRCLEKNARDRFPSARDVGKALRGVTAEAPSIRTATAPDSHPVVEANSGASRAEQGFWVAVLPF